jgi:hypothetical protein
MQITFITNELCIAKVLSSTGCTHRQACYGRERASRSSRTGALRACIRVRGAFVRVGLCEG